MSCNDDNNINNNNSSSNRSNSSSVSASNTLTTRRLPGNGLWELVELRRSGLSPPGSWRRSTQSLPALYSRLSQDTTLEGHRGCVNRLSWNNTGTLLASGSDDTCIFLWDYAR